VTCFSNKDKKKYSPRYCWYACCKDADLLIDHCPEDAVDPMTPEDASNEDGGKDKPASTYFHVEIF
jgi:hypothetical protein